MGKKKLLSVIFIAVAIITASFIVITINLPSTTSPSGGTTPGEDDTTPPPPPPNPSIVNIYVNSSIYYNFTTEILQYKQDIENYSYVVQVINWSDTNVTKLKTNISNTYSQGLVGVICIGEIPCAMGRYFDNAWGVFRKFPTDLYLTDLDGIWYDADGDDVYDCDPDNGNFEHSNGTGDWTPEIWLARISPYSIGMPGFNHTTAMKNFFKRDHELRNGTTTRPHKAMLFIDDDWSSYNASWLSNFTAYTGSNVSCYATNSLTTSLNYQMNLTAINYELIHVLVHSWPYNHTFGPNGNGADGVLTYQDISSTNKLPLFYNLFACFSCDYTLKNNTGTYYLFDNTAAITVIGSSRSGGMDLYQPFYDALDQGKTFGEAYRLWFHNPEILQLNKAPLYYGMTIFGDPLATIQMT